MTIMNEVEIKDNSSNENSESEPEAEASDSSVDEDVNDLTNTGWADAISKILKQKSKKKSLVLSKAKKLTDVKKTQKRTSDFEIEGVNGVENVKEETEDKESKADVPQLPKRKRKELPKIRVKPNILEKDRERLLQKVATKGVVQLFNAVKAQQKDITKKLEQAGPLEVRKEKVLKNIDKRAFLDVLMGEKSSIVETEANKKNETEKNTDKDTTWSILKEDFMMGAKMKDWDKELD